MTVTFEAITEEYERELERAEGRSLESLDDIPVSYEEITPRWLTNVLAADVPGAEVLECSLDAPSEGTSNRRRIFLTWNDAGKDAGLASSVFCKGTMSLENRLILSLNGGVAAEVTFHTDIRPSLPIHAPEAIFARYDPQTFNSIIVMHDIGGEVEFCTHAMTLTREQAESQLRLLATLHGRYFDRVENDPDLAVFNNWEDYFGITVEKVELGPTCDRGVEQASDVIPSGLLGRADEIWPATMACMEDNRRMPRTLIHSDVHLGNWFVAGDGEMGLCDWQCTSKGAWTRDVSYVLSTCLATEDRRAWERDLVAYYAEHLEGAGGPRIDVDEAWPSYRRQLFAALAWWTGTLGQPPDAPKMQPEEVSREFIARIAHAIDDLDALDAFE